MILVAEPQGFDTGTDLKRRRADMLKHNLRDARGSCLLCLVSFSFLSLAAPPSGAATIEGRVVDSAGHPVADVTVFNSGDTSARVETKTNPTGRFHLDGLPEGQCFWFAEHPAYRFTGGLLGDEPVQLVVSRLDEKIEPIRTRPLLLPAAEANALGRRVVDAYLDAIAASRFRRPEIAQGAKAGRTDDFSKTLALFALSNLDVLAAIERIDGMAYANADERERVRQDIIIGAIKYEQFDDWAELQAHIEAALSSGAKAACYTYAARRLFVDDPAQRRQLLSEALLHARAIADAERRALELARIAIAQSDVAEPAQAEAIAREAFTILDSLPVAHLVSWNVTGTVAEALGRFDVPAAQVLIERLHYNGVFSLELGRLACDVAQRDAVAGERLWKESGTRAGQKDDLKQRDLSFAAPICYRLALRDPAAARRVADSCNESAIHTLALAAVAQALAVSDAEAARRLARETLVRLPPVGSLGLGWGYTDAAALCQWLPLLETIDPQLGREFLWRAVALRPPRSTTGQLDDDAQEADLHLAGLVSRYDARLAKALLTPYLARFDEIAKSPNSSAALLISSVALIDPREAVKLADRLPAPHEARANFAADWARLMWLSMLNPQSDPRWEIGYHDPARYESW